MTRTILITGTSKGIGKYLAESYLAEHYNVAGCSRTKGVIQHDQYTHYSLDVGDEKSVVHMVRDVQRVYKRIDVLLNNAGIAGMNHFVSTPYDTLNRIFSTNVFGTFLFMREVGKVMVRQKSGSIVNFATIATPLHLAGEAAYAASKAAVIHLTRTAAKEFGDFGITVNAVGPTPIRTDLTRTIPKDKVDILIQKQALKRYGLFEDVKNVIDFFINEKSRFITGQTLYLGGIVD